MRSLGLFAPCLLFLATYAQAQDVSSGPEVGSPVPGLKVFDATGEHKGKEIDYAAQRKGKPTIYLLISAEKFDRPMNRFMKTLDGVVKKDFDDVYVVAVWLTDDADKTKELLPKVQESVKYETTALTCLSGAKEGPKDWNINADAHLTAVLATKAKVAARFAYRSLNETDVPEVKKGLDRVLADK